MEHVEGLLKSVTGLLGQYGVPASIIGGVLLVIFLVRGLGLADLISAWKKK